MAGVVFIRKEAPGAWLAVDRVYGVSSVFGTWRAAMAWATGQRKHHRRTLAEAPCWVQAQWRRV